MLMNDLFLRGDYGVVSTNYAALLIALLLAFVCGHIIAWIYMLTHTGLSYSRSYVNTLVIMPVIVAMVMMILANNLVLAFGLMAIFAMVRFRSILRDTLDTTYVLAVIVIGLACGTMKFTSAILGCLATAGIMLYFWTTAFGTRHRYDLILNVQWVRPPADLAELRTLLVRHSRTTQCASQRSNEGYPGVDISYRLLLRDPARTDDLMDELRALNGVARVSSLRAGDESEM
ncbi:MAG: putative rane protein [Pedosphaera sp.]|nr:putative rane protein [Pedosphaera sp.]